MKPHLLVITGLCLTFMAFFSPARAEGLKEGQWKMTMVTKVDSPEMDEAMKEMQNMPPEAMAMMKKIGGKNGIEFNGDNKGISVSLTQCMTQQNPIPKHMPSNEHCQETHEINGDTVNFHTTCNFDNTEIESTGEMKYSGDSMEGHIKSHEVRKGKATDSAIDINGQYVGPC